MDSNIKGDSGEKFVNDIAYKSFLKYWCYPSPKFENGNKKEICDLLIIFQDVCIIISVKNYEFKGNHVRYFNNTIGKAIKQVKGAQNLLFSQNEVAIKHPDKKTEIFPKQTFKKKFKLIVNLGEGLDFYEISHSSKENDFISIFNKDTFSIILNELDTIPDFIDYLEKRENLFKNKDVKAINFEIDSELNENDYSFLFKEIPRSIKIIGNEKDLLAYFFKNSRNFPQQVINNEDNNMVLVIEGAWAEFKDSYEAVHKYVEDKASYFVDEFIKNEVLKFDYAFKEELAKELLSLNRLQRRSLGKRFFDFFEKVRGYDNNIKHRRFTEFPNSKLGVIFFNYSDDFTYEDLVKYFELIFESFAYKYNYKHKTFILIGINKAPHFVYHIYKGYERFSLEDEKIIENNIKMLGWFTEYEEGEWIEYEFPE